MHSLNTPAGSLALREDPGTNSKACQCSLEKKQGLTSEVTNVADGYPAAAADSLLHKVCRKYHQARAEVDNPKIAPNGLLISYLFLSSEDKLIY